jgi:rhodanese-related sulfurtransferase
LGELAVYRDRDVVIYCATGNRSTVAAKILLDAGFERVYNIRYGIVDWWKNHLPVVR